VSFVPDHIHNNGNSEEFGRFVLGLKSLMGIDT
jgi:hypothetical protein